MSFVTPITLKKTVPLIILISLVVSIWCCRPEPRDADSWARIVTACKELVAEGERLDKEMWVRENHLLPPAISELSPRYVGIRTMEEAVVGDIQITGGFMHFGYLVVCHRNDPSFVPKKGQSWRIRKITPDVFEYKE